MTTIVLRYDYDKVKTCEIIKSLPLSPVQEVVIRDHHLSRSAAQSATYWMWCTEIAKATGETKDEVHTRFKRTHLRQIYERDDPHGYGEMIAAIRHVYRSGVKAQANLMFEQVIRLTSTTTATVDQFREYLDAIEKEAITQGIILTQPKQEPTIADRIREALTLLCGEDKQAKGDLVFEITGETRNPFDLKESEQSMLLWSLSEWIERLKEKP